MVEAELRVAKPEVSERMRGKEEAATLTREMATAAQRMKASASEHQ